ncbi:H-2 class II histocompatibility antigen, E-S beta chain-like [Monodelphis domestica]|uniref:H-2 class II histocompatibility antigen, E-S beta chain-like n=1 Tax=Monodelphis domestica TaxID=13616 RepID=UPI0024E201EB|nr:H-2 class II histocompatibility antigen, E-S beta chain-like [Monodelphis domestica]
MVSAQPLGGIWMEVLVVTLLVLTAQVAADRRPPKHFTEYSTSECYFINGTEQVQFVERYITNGEETVRFDSNVGVYQAVTESGRHDAEYWNSLKQRLEYARAAVDTYCKHNYEGLEPFLVRRRVEPEVLVYPSKTAPVGHHNLLVCSVSGFYPGAVAVTWSVNGQEQRAGVVSTGLMRNGDWTFQTLVMLEVTPQRGDVYTCHVEHSSLQKPVLVAWSAQSESAQSKMLSGVGGFVLGLIFFGGGLIVHMRSQKANRGSQPAGLLS